MRETSVLSVTASNCSKIGGVERKGVVVVGYEHTPPKIPLVTLLDAFELVATKVAGVRIGPRIQILRAGLRHPVHQQLIVAAWEVFSATAPVHRA